MFRRQIFQAVTFILIGVVIFLLLRGRNAEKEREVQNIRLQEISSESSSPARTILPRDLEVVEAEVSWTRNPDEAYASSARHDMTIHNTGGGSYVSLLLRIEYVNEDGAPVESRTHEVNEPLSPGETLRISDIVIDGLPDAATDFRTAILSADLESL